MSQLLEQEAAFFLLDIIAEFDRLERFTADMDVEEFLEDQKTMFAVQKSLENIGEACIRIEKLDAKAGIKYPKFPFSDLAGFKNKINHWYFQVEFDEIWITATEEIRDIEMQFYLDFDADLSALRALQSPQTTLELYRKLEGAFIRRLNVASAFKIMDERKAANEKSGESDPSP